MWQGLDGGSLQLVVASSASVLLQLAAVLTTGNGLFTIL
jgi:hypothetical protein